MQRQEEGLEGYDYLDLGNEVGGVLLRGAAVALVDVLCYHSSVCGACEYVGYWYMQFRLPQTCSNGLAFRGGGCRLVVRLTACKLLEDSPEHLAEISLPPTSKAYTTSTPTKNDR